MYPQVVSHQKNTIGKTFVTTAPLSALKQITGNDLVVGKTHIGSYIKLTITNAMQMVAVQITARDTKKQIVTLSLYNFPFKGKNYQHYFYPGVVLYVKEPFYKLTASGSIGIRVDDPTDVIFQKDLQNNNNSIEDKKAQGRDLVKKAQYIEAYCLYDDLLNQIPNDKDKCTILINKAIVCSQLNLKHQYQENIQKALNIDPTNQKAHFHLIKSHAINMDEPPTTQRFSKLRKAIKENENLSEESKKSLCQFVSLNEGYQKNEKIDWQKAIKTQNMGEYWSPKIKVGKSPYGRGVFATQKIFPGDILIIEKALGFVRYQLIQKARQQDFFQHNIMHLNSQIDFVAKIMPLFKLSGQFQKKIFTLCSKHYPGNKVNQNSRPKDRSQLESIFSQNAFNDYQLTNIFNKRKHYNLTNNYNLIFQKISLLNHQCENNCDRFNLDTNGIIYATREINPGEELFIYYMNSEDVQERQQLLKKWGIEHCRCLLCREQRGEHINKKQGQSYSKFYYASTYRKLAKGSLCWQTISRKIFGLFLAENVYSESIDHPLGDKILAEMFGLNPSQIQDLKNTYK